MIATMIFVFALLSVASDYYIVRRFLWKRTPGAVSWSYISAAVLINLSMVGLAFGYKYMIVSPDYMHVATWIIFFFLMTFFARLLFSGFAFAGGVLSMVFKRYKFRGFVYFGAFLALGLIGTMSYGALVGRTELRVEKIEILSDKLPAAFDGFRIVQFSDTHLGNWGDNYEVIEEMVEKINELKPDIVVQSGDLINVVSDELTPRLLEILSRIEAPVYAVLGNHDLGFYVFDTLKNDPRGIVSDLVAKQRAMGWRVLRNENEWLRRGADSIMIAGVTYPNNVAHNGYNSGEGGSDLRRAMSGIGAEDYSVLISHSPRLFDSLATVCPADLTLSGHVHAMQAKIELGSWRFSPAQWLYPMYSGLYHDRGRYLYVNDGIGFVLYPLRIGAKPEITLLTIKN